MKKKKKILSAVFVAGVIALLMIAGNVEQGASFGETIICTIIDFLVLAFSGFRSGLLTRPEE